MSMKSRKAFLEFEEIIVRLHRLSDDLIAVIDNQIGATISSDKERIEKYVEEYTTLRRIFKKQEYKFMDRLQTMLNQGDVNSVEVKLEHLKEIYPEYESTIDKWQMMLEQQMERLKMSHKKLNHLLEFAVEKNMELMHSIYRLNNRKNTRYSPSGNKEKISSGIALNTEA